MCRTYVAEKRRRFIKILAPIDLVTSPDTPHHLGWVFGGFRILVKTASGARAVFLRVLVCVDEHSCLFPLLMFLYTLIFVVGGGLVVGRGVGGVGVGVVSPVRVSSVR